MSFFSNIGFRWLPPFRPSPLPIPGAVVAVYQAGTQGASIAQFNVFKAGAAGMYTINFYVVVRRAATTSSSITATFGFNDGVAAQSLTTTTPGNASSPPAQGSFNIVLGAGQTLTMATTYASSGATSMQYDIAVSVERLG